MSKTMPVDVRGVLRDDDEALGLMDYPDFKGRNSNPGYFRISRGR